MGLVIVAVSVVGFACGLQIGGVLATAICDRLSLSKWIAMPFVAVVAILVGTMGGYFSGLAMARLTLPG